ncbi:hypothetical protein AAC387_Pa02g0504 [Persea americana]
MEIEHKKQRGRAGDRDRTKNSLPSFLSFFHSSPAMEMERAEIDFWAYVFVKNSKSIFGHMGIFPCPMWPLLRSFVEFKGRDEKDKEIGFFIDLRTLMILEMLFW